MILDITRFYTVDLEKKNCTVWSIKRGSSLREGAALISSDLCRYDCLVFIYCHDLFYGVLSVNACGIALEC
jgi:hypothetical protein